MNTNLQSVQQMVLSTFVRAAHRLSIHPRVEAITMFGMFPDHLMLVNWTYCPSFASRPATMCALFIGISSGSSLTAWLTESVSWIVGIVIVQLTTITCVFSTVDMYNIPRVVDCTQYLNEWVYSGDDHKRLLNTPPRDLPEYVRRFTQDIYMCVYINPGVGMYE